MGMASAAPASAQESDDAEEPAVRNLRGRGAIAVYVDDQDTTIVSPFGGAGVTVEEVEIDAAWTADVITSASVDVVTAATPQISELRHELSLSASRESVLLDVDLAGGLIYSTENDADSLIVQLGAKRGIAQDNFELGLNYALSYNTVGTSIEPHAERDTLWVQNGDLAFVWIMGPRTVVEAAYSTSFARGFQENPYRRVFVTWREDLVGANWVGENVPDVRWRNALTGRVQHAFSRELAGGLDYRFYVDTWGVLGHTATATLTYEPMEGFEVRFRQRASLQGGADFYAEKYEQETRYRTRDRRLSPHISGSTGLAVAWETGPVGPLGLLTLRLGVDALAFRYGDYLVPTPDPFGAAGFETLGWTTALVTHFGLEIRQ